MELKDIAAKIREFRDERDWAQFHNAGVAIEFNIPQTGKRVDFIVTGTRGDGQRTAVIVELTNRELVAQ